ncbi:MAG: LamG domain-containing protein, partial [Salibacteraceae bacterium]
MFIVTKLFRKITIIILISLTSLSSYTQVNLDSGLVGFFKLDSNYADSSAQSLHGASVNTSHSQGIHSLSNTGSSFNGSSSYISLGTSNRSVSNTITISVWVKTNTNSNNTECLVSKYDWSVNKGYLLKYKNGYPDIQGRNNSGSYMSTSNTTMFIADGNWHHLIGVIADNTWQIWVDGVLASSTTSFGQNTSITNSYPTTVGAYYSQGSRSMYYGGILDEVRIYNRTLLSTEISYLANQQNNSAIQNFSTCNTYTSPWDGALWNNSGKYSSIKYGSDVADSIQIIDLVVNSIDTSVTVNGPAVHAVFNPNYSYQWIDCSVNLPIIGEQDSIFAPLQNGSYAVVITNGTCTDTSSCVSYTRPTVNLTSDLVADFRLNGNQGDSSVIGIHGAGYSLTSTNGINNQNNKAYDFNGVSSKVNCGTNNRTITHSVSVSAWVKTTVTMGNYFVVEKYNWPSDKGYALFIKNGIPLMQARNTSGAGAHTYDYVNQQTFYVNDGQWHHIVGVVNQNDIEIWVDGILEATATQTATNPDLTSTSNLSIGYNGYGSNNYFLGAIDEVKIYKSGIDSLQIDSLYRSRNTYLNLSASTCFSYTSP